LTTAERKELAELRRENRVLRMERDLQPSSPRIMSCRDDLRVHRGGEGELSDRGHVPAPGGVDERVLRVASRSPSVRAVADEVLTERIRQIHHASRGTNGSPLVHAELRLGDEVACGRKRVER
jgi:HTH-like domain